MIRHKYENIFDFLKRAPLSRLHQPEVLDALFLRTDLQWELHHLVRGNIEKSFVSIPWLVDLFGADLLRRNCWADKLGNRVFIKCSGKYAAFVRISSRKKGIKDSPFRKGVAGQTDHQE